MASLEELRIDFYIDPYSLYVVNICLKIVQQLEFLLRITRYASYKLLVGLIGFFLLSHWTFHAFWLFVDWQRNYPAIDAKEQMLKEIRSNNIHLSFLNNVRLSCGIDDKRQWSTYVSFMKFLEEDLKNVYINHKVIDDFVKHAYTLNIIINSFPLLFNLSWRINILTLIATILNKFIMEQSNESSLLFMLFINFILASTLLSIHWCNIIFLLSTYMGQRFP